LRVGERDITSSAESFCGDLVEGDGVSERGTMDWGPGWRTILWEAWGVSNLGMVEAGDYGEIAADGLEDLEVMPCSFIRPIRPVSGNNSGV